MMNDSESCFKLGRFQLETWLPEMLEEHHHDHECDFWVYPFSSYVEQVLLPKNGAQWVQTIPAHKWRKFPAEHTHIMLGAYMGLNEFQGFPEPQRDIVKPVYVLVYRGKKRRSWGYWVKNVWFSAEAYMRGAFRLNWVDYN